MKTMLDNYINGNIKDARRQARSLNKLSIVLALKNDYGYSIEKAMAVAHHIKTGEGWQEACDAK